MVGALATPGRTPLGQAVIDCDIHTAVPSVQALFPYLETVQNRGRLVVRRPDDALR